MDSQPKKLGRGRPPGSLNAKGSRKRGYVEDTPSTASTHVLDVDFESEEILGGEDLFSEEETVSAVEELPPSPPPSPKPVRKKPAKREAREPVEAVPAPVTQRERGAREQSSPPASKPKAKPRKARTVTDVRQETPPQITPDDYLGFLRRITDISNARNRSARVERYDSFFRV